MPTTPTTPQNTAPTTKPEGEKLQKLLARMGLGSRRQLEEIIKTGRISINGTIATLGDRATPSDEIRVDGRLVRVKAEREKSVAVSSPIISPKAKFVPQTIPKVAPPYLTACPN